MADLDELVSGKCPSIQISGLDSSMWQALIFGRLDLQRCAVCIHGLAGGLDVREFEYLGAQAFRVWWGGPWGLGLEVCPESRVRVSVFRVLGPGSRGWLYIPSIKNPIVHIHPEPKALEPSGL